MFLTRLRLNERSRAVRRDLADCQQLHRTVMGAFSADGGGRAAMAVLHRLELGRGGVTLYVQSGVSPCWTHLPDDYLVVSLDGDNPAIRTLDEAWATLERGRELVFRLRANPTRKIDTKTGLDGRRRNGRRVPLTGEAELLCWLARKAEASGFTLATTAADAQVFDVSVVEEPLVGGSRAGRRSGGTGERARLSFRPVTFEGRLRVTDAEALKRALRDGIGPAKAYGFGLLSIAG